MFVFHRVQIRIHFTTESFHLRQNAQVYKNVAARDKVSTTKGRKESNNINGLGQKNIKIAKKILLARLQENKKIDKFLDTGVDGPSVQSYLLKMKEKIMKQNEKSHQKKTTVDSISV